MDYLFDFKNMEIERFKSKLTKGQLEAMAIDTVKKQMENIDQASILLFAKKLKHFADVFVKEAENEAKLVWENIRDEHPEMNYTSGGALYDLNQFEYRKQIAEHLKEIDDQLKKAAKSDNPQFVPNIITGEVISVPKIKPKGYRKDSINVKL
jgi:hypothetical protein